MISKLAYETERIITLKDVSILLEVAKLGLINLSV